MKTPSSNTPGGRGGSGKKPFRAGGPRPSTPRPPSERSAQPPRERRPEPSAALAPARVSDRPVLTIATKGAFGRPEADLAPARVPERQSDRQSDRQSERPQGKRPYQGGRSSTPRAPVVKHDIDAPKGTIWLYGIHAIGAALQNPQRRLRRLLLTAEAETALAAEFPKPWPIPSESTDRARLDLLLGQNVVHQGAALLADPLGSPSLVQALERPGYVLVLDQVSDPRTVGAILRSAAVFGACCVITQDRNAPDESGALAKAASGALEKIPLLRAVNIARTLVALKAAGFLAGGGPADSGKPYVVGEEGPELFIPNGSGTVIPNGARASMAGSGGATIVYNITSGVQRNDLAPILEQHSARIKGDLYRAKVRGGSPARAMA